jgi:ABC-2 type transport system permease protein
MNTRLITTLVRKDFVLFFKNRYFAVVTVLGIVVYAVIYFVMPAQADETLEIGIVAPDVLGAFVSQLEEGGLILLEFESESALRAAVAEGAPAVGIRFPEDLVSSLRSGSRPTANVYFSADLPTEFRELYPILVEEWISAMAGQPLSIEVNAEVLGVDTAGEQIAPRDRMLPLFAVFILVLESFGLANLIASEITAGTIRALLITPLRVEGLFLGKGITGVGLAFSESTVLMAITGGLNEEPLIVITALLIGSILVTGIGFMIASFSKDLMSVMSRGMLAMLVLGIPAFNVLLPGLTTDWIKVLPSYYLVDPIHRVMNFGAGWSEVAGQLGLLLLFAAAFVAIGIVTLKRRFA